MNAPRLFRSIRPIEYRALLRSVLIALAAAAAICASPVQSSALSLQSSAFTSAQNTAGRNDKPLLMVVSQPGPTDRRAEFVDMGYFLARSVQEAGRYTVVLYSPEEARVKAALEAGRLTRDDVAAYLSDAAARKVAEAIGAVYLVQVTASRTREGIGAQAGMHVRIGNSAWSTFFNAALVPYKSRDRKSQLLEAIHAHVGALVPRIMAAPPVAPANVAKSGEPKSEPAKADQKPQQPTNPADQNAPTAADILVDRFRRSGDTANLILTLRKAITERPREAKLRRELVVALRLRGWTESARDEAARALLICPADAGLRRLLGDGYLDMGQVAEALDAYREAIRLEPGNPANHVALGDAYWSQTRTAEAEAAYKAAQDADPKNPLPRLRMARMRAQALRCSDVAAEMTEAHKLVGGGDETLYASAYAEVCALLDAGARDIVGRLIVIRRDMLNGTRSREESHKAADACRTSAVAIADCLTATPIPSRYAAVQNSMLQAASLLAQAAAAYLSHLETQAESDDKEASLLRQEAVRQFDEAARKLDALKAPSPSP